jgi:hypothetical protein
VNCFQKCGFNLNQTNDGEDATELGIAEDDWGQLKAGVLIEEYASCDNYIVMCEVQTLQQMTNEKFTSDVSDKDDDGRKGEPPAIFLSALEGTYIWEEISHEV